MWKDISGFSNYQINESGQILNKNSNIIRKPYINNGYQRITLVDDNGVKKGKFVHRLVLETFNPIKNDKEYEVNHLNFNKLDNNLTNLEWTTQRENSNHARQKYDTVGYKLSEAEVLEILVAFFDNPFRPSLYKIATLYHVDASSIRKVLNGESYPHIFNAFVSEKYNKISGLPFRIIKAIKHFEGKLSSRKVAKLFDCGKTTVNDIWNNRYNKYKLV